MAGSRAQLTVFYFLHFPLIIFANCLDPDQAWQYVRPDLYLNCLTRLMVFLEEFLEKLILKNPQQMTKKQANFIYPHAIGMMVGVPELINSRQEKLMCNRMLPDLTVTIAAEFYGSLRCFINVSIATLCRKTKIIPPLSWQLPCRLTLEACIENNMK